MTIKYPINDITIEGCSVYIQLSDEKIKRTVDCSLPTVIITSDFDKDDELVGIESIGFKRFSFKETIKQINKVVNKEHSSVDTNTR